MDASEPLYTRMDSKDNDLVLIERAKSGDKASFEALVLKYQDRVYNICRYMLGSAAEAEDAAQDAFIKAFKNLSTFTPAPGFSAWITRIAVNTCLDYKRKPSHIAVIRTSAEGGEYELEAASNDPGPEGALQLKETGTLIERAIGRLSEKLRAVIVLSEIEGLSYEEMARALDISIGTVKSRLSRAREELKRLLERSREHI